jgi:putative ABC transport system permease protein
MRNYVLVLLRTLRRERLYAAINIAGLALGVAASVLIGLFVWSELTYDRHFSHHENIYRVVFGGGRSKNQFAATSRVLGPMVARENPYVKAYVRFQNNGVGALNGSALAIRHGKDLYFWDNAYFASDNVFDVFSHHILYGDPKTALKDGSSVAISETVAKKYFGNANPIGEVLTTDAGTPLRVSLVFADLPPNTHLEYDLLFSEHTPLLKDADSRALWEFRDNYTYLLMAPGFDPKSWASFSDEFFRRNMTGFGLERPWMTQLQPLTWIHLHSDLQLDLPTGNPLYLYGCAAVALFILTIACVNYVNLATARAARRAHSVGIRKILGANRFALALQFLGEAILFSLVAVIIGVAIVETVLQLTSINSLMGRQVSLDLMHQPGLIAVLIGLAVVMGLLSGLYPAVYLSSWAPLSALSSQNVARKSHQWLREVLVLVQFMISVAVIACTLLMMAQMRYVSGKGLGFQKENQVMVELRGTSTIDQVNTLRTALAKNPNIRGSTEVQAAMGDVPDYHSMEIEDNTGALTRMPVNILHVGDDFVSVMGLKIVRGRDFTSRLRTDVGVNWLVNEAFVRKLGWTEPLGKRIRSEGVDGRVVGVMADFNYKSLHTRVEPVLAFQSPDDFTGLPEALRPFQQRKLVVKIAGTDVNGTLRYIGDVMSRADPRHPFEFEFLDQRLDRLYNSERQLTQLIGIFAALCVFIACLGLFGLASFSTEQRSREIGTRKVLGATSWQIITLLSQRILVLVLMGSALAVAISYFAMDEWLTGFAYRAGINPLLFVLSAAIATIVALGTVALQSYKTARADPVEIMRS